MIERVYAAIAAELVDVNAYVTTILVGDEHVAENLPPPRIVCIPDSDEFLTADGTGGNPKPIKDRKHTTELVIWGQSREIVEGMIDQFVIALHAACKKASANTSRAAGYSLGKGKWTRKSNLLVNGFEWKSTFAVNIPVVKRSWADYVSGAAQAPDASSYDDRQADTYATVSRDAGVERAGATADVGVTDGAADNVSIVIPAIPTEE